MFGDRPCGIYSPGHRVHFIQARKAAAEQGEPATLLGIRDSTIVLGVGEGVRVYGNHDPRRVQVFAEEFGEVHLIERWHVLRIAGIGRRWLFSLVANGPPERRCEERDDPMET
jgi:hypothetical protein